MSVAVFYNWKTRQEKGSARSGVPQPVNKGVNDLSRGVLAVERHRIEAQLAPVGHRMYVYVTDRREPNYRVEKVGASLSNSNPEMNRVVHRGLSKYSHGRIGSRRCDEKLAPEVLESLRFKRAYEKGQHDVVESLLEGLKLVLWSGKYLWMQRDSAR